MAKSLHLDVVIDVVCPWCFLGKRRLDAAMADVPEIDFAVRYRPFQLDGTIPPEGKDRQAYLVDKFRDPARIEAAHAHLVELGKAVGIDFRFDLIKVAPNTFDAHRLLRWAQAEGKGDAMVERLYALFFTEGADLSKTETLAGAARDVGMDGDAVARDLASARDRSSIEEEIDFSHRIGITGVPCTIVASKYAISGAQPPEALVDAFRQISEEAA